MTAALLLLVVFDNCAVLETDPAVAIVEVLLLCWGMEGVDEGEGATRGADPPPPPAAKCAKFCCCCCCC